jgi:hypothetical protein
MSVLVCISRAIAELYCVFGKSLASKDGLAQTFDTQGPCYRDCS